MIKLVNVNKFYNEGKINELHVLNDVSIEIPEVGLTVILGHSGSGKTTLLNVIGGLDTAEGKILYNDVELGRSTRVIDEYRSKNIGYIFQNYNLFPEYTVYENLSIAAELYGIRNKIEIDKRIDYCLGAVGMERFKRRLALTLSGGQQQRVAIARALIKNCSILIADEPTGNLDSRNTLDVISILRSISQNKAVILVTHENELAYAYADTIIEIIDGQIVKCVPNIAGNVDISDSAIEKVIYEGDMQSEKLDSTFFSFEAFTDSPSIPKTAISLYYHEGEIYLKTDVKVKIIGVNSEVMISEGKYAKRKAAVDVNVFSPEFTDEFVQNFSDSMRRFGASLRASFYRFAFGNGKMGRFMNVLFLLLGFMVSAIVFASGIILNSGKKEALLIQEFDAEAISISPYSGMSRRSFLSEISKWFDDEKINFGQFTNENPTTQYFTLALSVSNVNIRTTGYSSYKPVSIRDRYKIVQGRVLSNDDEVMIDKNVADDLINVHNASFSNEIAYRDLIGKKIYSSRGDGSLKEIVGIVNHVSNFVYCSDAYFYISELNSKPAWFDKFFDSKNEHFAMYDGEVVDEYFHTGANYSKVNVYITSSLYEWGQMQINNVNYLGIINAEEGVDKVYFASQRDYDLYLAGLGLGIFTSNVNYIEFELNGYICTSGILYPYSDEVELLAGTKPTKNTDILVSRQMYETVTNETVFREYTTKAMNRVVGIYEAKMGFENVLYVTNRALIKQYFFVNGSLYVNYNVEASTLLLSANSSKVNKKFFEAYNYEVFSHFGRLRAFETERIRSSYELLLSIFTGMLIIMVIFIYFPMRSKAIKNVYPLGVYRALGAKRAKLAKTFLFDSIVIATFTAVLGYLVIQMVLYVFGSEMGLPSFDWGLHLSVVGGLYLAFIVFGMLPVVTLLSKKPATILTKYDI